MSAILLRLTTEEGSRQPVRFSFTVKELGRIQPTGKQVWVYDTAAPGLAMLTTPAGAKTFYFAKRMDGRYRRVKIGPFPGVSVEQARKVALREINKVAEGRNPAEERRQARAAMTFGDLFASYLAKHAQLHKRTWQEDQRQYERHLKRWSGRQLEQITRQDVAALHASLGKRAPVAANRLLALLSKVYTFAGEEGFDGKHPAKGIRRFAERSRDRFLDPDELPRFLAAVEAYEDETFRDFFRLLLFTGQRRENVSSMRWDEIDLNRRVWIIPAEKFKTGQAVDVPLVPAVMEIIQARGAAALQKAAEDDPRRAFVFPSRRREARVPHLYEPKGAFSRICEQADISGLTIHDLRRTCASWATMQGVPYPVVARMVGHKPQGVTSIYARFDLSAVRDGFERTVNAMLEHTRAFQTREVSE